MTLHETIVLDRRFEAAASTVFGLFADDDLWRRWFKMPGSNAQ
jgi:uncharacterized protein YndB with AHSA1/START domain